MDEDYIDVENMAIFEEKMRGLTREYIVQLETWGNEMRAIAGHKMWDEKDRNALIMILHQIAGSAGMYGFSELGLAARGLENRLEEEPDAAARGDLVAPLQAFLESCAAAKA